MSDGQPRERRGCLCLLFISDEHGTHAGSYTRDCRTHRRILEDNRVTD